MYPSDHASRLDVNRDGPAATTVELPVGTEAGRRGVDIGATVPIGRRQRRSLTVTVIDRAFFLGPDYLPQAVLRRVAQQPRADRCLTDRGAVVGGLRRLIIPPGPQLDRAVRSATAGIHCSGA